MQVQVTAKGDSLREPRPAHSAGIPLDTAWGIHPTDASTGLMATKQWGSNLLCASTARGRQTTAEVIVRITEKSSRTPQRALLLFGNKPSLALQLLFTELKAVLQRSHTAMQINTDIFSWSPHYKITFYFGCSQVLYTTTL